MNLLEAIGDVVRTEFRRDGLLRLHEADPGSSFKPVTINKSGPGLLLKLDGLPPPACAQPGCQLRYSPNDRMFPLFKTESSGLTALCDYILFYQERTDEDAPLFVFLCELKSGNPGRARHQAQNGRLLADYVVNMATHHRKPSARPTLEHRGLVFSRSFELPNLAGRNARCAYFGSGQGTHAMKFAYLRDGTSYPLSYFCN